MERNAIAAAVLLCVCLVLPPPRTVTGGGPAPGPDITTTLVNNRSVLDWVDSFGTSSSRGTLARVAAHLRSRSALTDDLVPQLIPLLEAEGEARRRGAAYLLASLGPDHARPAVPRLVAQLEHEPDPISYAMLLFRLDGAREGTIEALVRRIERGAARGGGNVVGDHAAPPGSSRLQRRACLRDLAHAAPDAGRASLIRCLRSPEPWLRQEAAEHLGDLGPRARDAVPALEACLDDGDRVLRAKAAVALVMIDGSPGRAGEPVAPGAADPVPVAIRRLFALRRGRKMSDLGAWLMVSRSEEADGVYVLTPVMETTALGSAPEETLRAETERFCRYLCLRGITVTPGAQPIIVQASADEGFRCGTP